MGRAPAPPRRGHANNDTSALQLWHIPEEVKRILRRPAQRMKNLASVYHLL
jgi:hypothetical protein